MRFWGKFRQECLSLKASFVKKLYISLISQHAEFIRCFSFYVYMHVFRYGKTTKIYLEKLWNRFIHIQNVNLRFIIRAN